MSRARLGKVARLRAELREGINKQLYDGMSGPQILAWLKDHNASDITQQNLSEWRKGGYQDWLKTEGQMSKIRDRAELAMRMAQAAGGSLAQSIVSRIAGDMDEKLDALGEDDLLKLRPILDSVLYAERLRLAQQKLNQNDQQIEISRAKFQRETAELFLKWVENEQVKKIVEGKGDKEVKMDRLVKLIWGERPETNQLGK